MYKYIIVVVTIFTVLIIYRVIRGYTTNKKYGISLEGGRGGDMIYKKDGKTAKIEYEMLEGGNELVLYNNMIEWSLPRKEKFSTNDKEIFYQTVNAWVLEHKHTLKYSVDV